MCDGGGESPDRAIGQFSLASFLRKGAYEGVLRKLVTFLLASVVVVPVANSDVEPEPEGCHVQLVASAGLVDVKHLLRKRQNRFKPIRILHIYECRLARNEPFQCPVVGIFEANPNLARLKCSLSNFFKGNTAFDEPFSKLFQVKKRTSTVFPQCLEMLHMFFLPAR